MKPIHQMMVQKELMDAGLVKAGMVPMIGYATFAQKTKAVPKPKVAKKNTASVKRSTSPKRGHKLDA